MCKICYIASFLGQQKTYIIASFLKPTISSRKQQISVGFFILFKSIQPTLLWPFIKLLSINLCPILLTETRKMEKIEVNRTPSYHNFLEMTELCEELLLFFQTYFSKSFLILLVTSVTSPSAWKTMRTKNYTQYLSRLKNTNLASTVKFGYYKQLGTGNFCSL